MNCMPSGKEKKETCLQEGMKLGYDVMGDTICCNSDLEMWLTC